MGTIGSFVAGAVRYRDIGVFAFGKVLAVERADGLRLREIAKRLVYGHLEKDYPRTLCFEAFYLKCQFQSAESDSRYRVLC